MANLSRIVRLKIGDLFEALTPAQKEELEALEKQFPDYADFLRKHAKQDIIARNSRALDQVDEEKMFTELMYNIHADPPGTRVKKSLWKIIGGGIAASLILIVLAPQFLSCRSLYSSYHSSESTTRINEMSAEVPEPLLILFRGDTVRLATMPEGGIAKLGNWLITKKSGRHLAYQYMGYPDRNADLLDSLYNTLFIPKNDSQWQISLPDESRVILDPGSSLAILLHPLGMAAQQRVLLLEGTATFSIKTNDSIPFRVETRNGEITAYGTFFSVSDLKKENKARITLFSGKLKVCNGENATSLLSAQKATINPSSSKIQVEPIAAILNKMPWESGFYDFTKQRLPDVMRTIASMYGLPKAIVGSGIDTVTRGWLIDGHVSKDLSLPDLLHTLSTDTLHFILLNKTIFVSKQTLPIEQN